MGEPLALARPGFLDGCGLPAAWAGQRQWRILATAFGAGEDFLAAWRAWKDDPRRPGLLHFVAIDEHPVAASQLLATAAADPRLLPLTRQLAGQWFGLLPGFHRLAFDDGRVLLTLCVGDLRELLREQDFSTDSVFLARGGDLHGLKAIARLCRHGAALAMAPGGSSGPHVASELAQCGFALPPPGAAPTQPLQATYAPAWKVRKTRAANPPSPGSCVVVGAGLAGAAVAASLARRGWAPTVLDAAADPASGASALPAGVLVPHQSPDDSLLSRLSRSGVRLTLQQARALLREGLDWQAGVLEHRAYDPPLPASDADARAAAWSRAADPQHKRQALLPMEAPAYWHEQAAWISPAALVRAWLAQPGVSWRGGARVVRIVRQPDGWQLLDAAGEELARAGLVVVAAAHESAALLATGLPLQPVRGQVSWALREPGQRLPPFPVPACRWRRATPGCAVPASTAVTTILRHGQRITRPTWSGCVPRCRPWRGNSHRPSTQARYGPGPGCAAPRPTAGPCWVKSNRACGSARRWARAA